jgi:hypothetical protein
MKRQLYIVPALILMVGIAWSHGYRSNYGSNLYGIGSPYHPNLTANLYSANASQFYNNHYHGRLNNKTFAPNSVSSFSKYHEYLYFPNSTYTPYSGGSPYTPYSPPDLSGTYINPYAPNSINNLYDGNIANSYEIYGNPYNSNSADGTYSKNVQQFYNSHRHYRENLTNNPNSVLAPYAPYNNPYFPGLINNR